MSLKHAIAILGYDNNGSIRLHLPNMFPFSLIKYSKYINPLKAWWQRKFIHAIVTRNKRAYIGLFDKNTKENVLIGINSYFISSSIN